MRIHLPSLLVAAAACAAIVAPAAHAASFTVTNTNDSGPGSLRAAIVDANNTAGSPHTIGFAIPGTGAHVITPATALPDVTVPVTIDGFTQAGAQPNSLALGSDAVYKIVLDGSSAAGIGLTLSGGNSTVRGLEVLKWNDVGIQTFSGGNHIEGNLVHQNAFAGISLVGDGNTVGGDAPAERNVVSFNSAHGVDVSGAGSVVEGNWIGLSTNAVGDYGNGTDGVFVSNSAPGATIRGNAISGNDGPGIDVAQNAAGATIDDNLVGTSAAGSACTANSGPGLRVRAQNATVAGNAVHCNLEDGIVLDGAGGAALKANEIGAPGMGNDGAGILVQNAGGQNRIGDTSGRGNTIRSNTDAGVRVLDGTGNAIEGNKIERNGGLPIKLGAASTPLANDALDGDSGPNDLQNKPVIDSVTTSGAGTTVHASLGSQANLSYAIDLYTSEGCAMPGPADYLGRFNVGTDGAGNAEISPTLLNPGVRLRSASYNAEEGGSVTITVERTGGISAVVATATRALSTSEVSNCVTTDAPVAEPSVAYSTQDGTARAGSDYTPTSGRLAFAAGETEKTFTVPILDDPGGEDAEAFTVALSDSSGAAIADPRTATVTIASSDGGRQDVADDFGRNHNPPPPPPPAAEPDSAIAPLARKPKRITGTATRAVKVEIAVVRRDARKRCSALTRAGKVKRARSCTPRIWLRARGTAHWSYTLKKRLPRGSYVVYSRASDGRGHVERVPARRSFRVR